MTHLAGRRIELDHAVAEHRPTLPALAPYDRAQAREQFAGLERLDQIVVGAEIEAANPLLDAVPRGHDQDRQLVAALTQAAEHRKAVPPRQTEIEQQGLIGHGGRAGECRRAVAHPVDRMAGIAQGLLGRRAEHGIVLDQQDPHGRYLTRIRGIGDRDRTLSPS